MKPMNQKLGRKVISILGGIIGLAKSRKLKKYSRFVSIGKYSENFDKLFLL